MKTDPFRAARPQYLLTHVLALMALAAAPLSSVHADDALQRASLPKAAALVTAGQVALRSPASLRWQSSLANFAKADQAQLPASDGVLFVGSSTIRLWPHLSQDFRQQPVLINRGFGGSTMADCNALTRELVTQYKPSRILVYAGDNDLAEGRSPGNVLASFTSFVQSVRAELPDSRIAYISIKPSPSRLALLPRIRETNTLIANYVQTLPGGRYIDIFTPMLDKDGAPRPELFLSDRLHLNEAGYHLWQSVIASQIPAAPQTQQRPASNPEAGPVATSLLPPHTAR